MESKEPQVTVTDEVDKSPATRAGEEVKISVGPLDVATSQNKKENAPGKRS